MSEQERLILVSLIRNGPSTARDLANKTSIRQNKVYSFLQSLSEKQFVSTVGKLGRQNLYSVSIDRVRVLMGEEKIELDKQLQEICKIQEELESVADKFPMLPSTELWIGRAADAVKETKRLIKDSEKSIWMGSYIMSWYDEVIDDIICKVKTGTKARVLLIDPTSSLLSPKHSDEIRKTAEVLRSQGIDVRFTPKRSPFRGTIVDGEAFLAMMFSYNNEIDMEVADRFCVCRNNAIARLVSDYFSFVWKESSSVSQK